ncbi:MAG: hypothetical protein IJA89_00770 [Clostridia bacterium]|nr:hypothetical protein [Clostridiales bacterium]MBQ3505286.1 hypothetical protein [Clostridia bacterium]
MKKFLCVVFALATVFCFAGCKNGKCDECKSDDATVAYYEDIKEELCAKCAYKRALEEMTK